jgi:hypothetical protein
MFYASARGAAAWKSDMQSDPLQTDPAPLRISYWALARLRRAYPTRFDPTIQALRIRCRVAYKRWRLPGLLVVWVSILWQLQVTLPYITGLPSLWQQLRASQASSGRRATFPAPPPRMGVRLYYRRRRPSRRELLLSLLALLMLLPILFGYL